MKNIYRNRWLNSTLNKSMLLFTLSLTLATFKGNSQSFFVPSDTLSASRLKVAITTAAVTTTIFSIALYNTWYKMFDKEQFHFFNDWSEWNHMDKAGHIHTTYFQSALCYKAARWTGLNKKKSLTTGMISGMLLQTTVEIFDGFSSKWGFSIPDMGANVAGATVFGLQQHFWDEQRVVIKISSIPKKYDSSPILSSNRVSSTTLDQRAKSLFGSNYLENFIKDYNAQNYWASVNLHSFLHEGNAWPKWLNIAFGYSGENLYGGFTNAWTENGDTYILDKDLYPRYSQFFLSFDIDFPKIKTKSPFVQTILSGLNIFKLPSPTIELNTEGRVVFHLFR